MESGHLANGRADLLLRAARGEKTERTPVWMMRQAGRTDPQYLAVRERSGLPLESLFKQVDYAIEISLLPKRIGVDAIIFFQDILTPLGPMGADFVFRPGPVLDHPIRTSRDIDSLKGDFDPSRELPFVGETLTQLRNSLKDELPLLGFAGAPLTLLFFLVEGKSPGGGKQAFDLLESRPEDAHRLLAQLTRMTVAYLKYQIESGAQAVQLFESIADLLPAGVYRDFALPYQQAIFNELRGLAPTILFAKGYPDLLLMKQAGADVLSITSEVSIGEARRTVGAETVLQGNVSNRLLAVGSPEEIRGAVEACLREGESHGHILNLDHGLLRETPWEKVQYFVECAKRA